MSETTKRIEEIINGQFGGSDSMLLVQYGSTVERLATPIATHLHQEVIRGKIEENKRYLEPFNELDSPEDVAHWRIKDLQQQLGELQ